MTEPQEHSIRRHPLQDVLPKEEFAEIVRQVQFGEISWPVGIDLQKPEKETPE